MLKGCPALLKDVRRLIDEGNLSQVSDFNRAQVTDEQMKVKFINEEPSLERILFRLEDHTLLRGSLAAFELNALVFERRARAFHDLFDDTNLLPVLTGALPRCRRLFPPRQPPIFDARIERRHFTVAEGHPYGL